MFYLNVDIFDENFQPDFYCSSRENTDSESEPEIEVVDLTVDTAPDTWLTLTEVNLWQHFLKKHFVLQKRQLKRLYQKKMVINSKILKSNLFK